MRITTPLQTTMEGTPEEILGQISAARKFDNMTGDDLIKEVCRATWVAFGVGLHVTGETYAERAESLLQELYKNNLVDIEEEE